MKKGVKIIGKNERHRFALYLLDQILCFLLQFSRMNHSKTSC